MADERQRDQHRRCKSPSSTTAACVNVPGTQKLASPGTHRQEMHVTFEHDFPRPGPPGPGFESHGQELPVNIEDDLSTLVVGRPTRALGLGADPEPFFKGPCGQEMQTIFEHDLERLEDRSPHRSFAARCLAALRCMLVTGPSDRRYLGRPGVP